MLELPLTLGYYEIRVAEGSQFSEKHKDMKVYQVVNTETGVVEGESFSLPRCMLQAKASTMSITRLLDAEISDSELIAIEEVHDGLEDDQTIIRPH